MDPSRDRRPLGLLPAHHGLSAGRMRLEHREAHLRRLDQLLERLAERRRERRGESDQGDRGQPPEDQA